MMNLAHMIWWHVYPLGACGAPIRPADNAGDWEGHRLGLLEEWLDYVVDLGCNGLLLGPVFASTSHGYDTLDYYRIDPRLGDEDDWDRFVHQTRSRGLSIMLDGVFNHVSADHCLVADAIAGSTGMIRMVDGAHASWEGHGELAELDHDDPRVLDLVVDVMTHWLDRGASGWRLDVAYKVPTWFWARALARVRTTHPGAVFLGEVIHGDFAQIAKDSTLDMVTAYEVWKAIWSSINDRNAWELAWALERHSEFSSLTWMQTFVGNHDVTRIASRIGDEGAGLAAIILFTLPGVPSVYYGDEQAFRGIKTETWGGDDEIRPALPSSPELLPPDGRWLHSLYREAIAMRRANPWLASSRLEVLDKTNTTLAYAAREEAEQGHELVARLDITDRFAATITIDGERVIEWEA